MPRPSDRASRPGTPGRMRQLRVKTARVARTLEEFLGVPTQAPVLPRPLDMLIATVLSQNTNDKNSHRAYSALRKRYPTWRELAAAPVRSIATTIRSGGMADQKAGRIKNILSEVRRWSGSYSLESLRVMTDEDVISTLTELHGVGVKTASCVLLFSLGRDIFPVDTHIHRICGRLALTSGCTTPEKTFEQMRPLIPAGKAYSFHTNLIRFGRKICRSNNPACDRCPLFDECAFQGKRGRSMTRRTRSLTNHDFMLLDNV